MIEAINIEICALSGDVTVRECESIRNQLSVALESGVSLVLDCAAITRVDLTFIQLLLAARKSAAAAGVALTLRHPTAGVLAEALARAGIPAPDADPSDPDHLFWNNTLEYRDGQYHPHGG